MELVQRCVPPGVDGRGTGTPTECTARGGPNMHLNRWQRMIGIVASVCLFIGATTWIDVSVTDQLQKRAGSEYHDCQEKAPEDQPSCPAKFARDFRAATHFHWQAALYALIPIPVVWLIIYGLVALVRWIKSPRHSQSALHTSDRI
jgi:hypothetical protein